MGLLGKKAADAAEAIAQIEERYAANLHQEFDNANAIIANAKAKARTRAAELVALADVAKNAAKYLKDHFHGE